MVVNRVRPPPPFPSPDALRPTAELIARVEQLELQVVELTRRQAGISAPEAERQARALFRVMTQPVVAALTQRDAQRDQSLGDAIRRIERLETALRAHREEMSRAAASLDGSVRGVRAEVLIGVGLAVATLILGAAALLIR